ncbi:DUF998 domain-containing protein [Streptomyces sp. SID14478]|uniref:DUF998 domain-containing protein n=1 Tax=Streptomyces sp. SID14478 TaxID=2706073 RepID=UPI0013DCF279|nr:DUF998 domain-containing protein [Streptomyces sp. SID14478]NEB74216.1 DUF998 domain-containing protein [Streptomyces sp. SID14478]
MRHAWPAVGLFLLAPVIGELLLGATSSDMLGVLPILALLYGGGALLIREVVRRAGRGWCAILLLGAAYALVEEGLLDQMLFNADYSGNYDMVSVTHLPFLGTGAYGLLSVLAVHAVWSVTVPIALMEALVPGRARGPWLGRTGLTVTAVLFGLGAVIVGWGSYDDSHFMAPWPRLAGTAVVAALLVVAAFRIRRPMPGTAGRGAPRPLLVGAAAFLATTGFWLALQASWWGVAASLAVAVAATALGISWSRRPGWGPAQVYALAAGATLTYAWIGFGQTPDVGSDGTVNLVGHVVLAVGAVALLCVAGRRVRADEEALRSRGPAPAPRGADPAR